MHKRHLEYYVAVADELHFGRAALRLHVSQPALTQQIRQLEKEVGGSLLDRTTRRVELTQAGVLFLHHAQRALDEIALGIRAVGQAAAGETGHLSVGFAGSTTYELMPRLMHEYRRRQPDVTIEIHNEMLTGTQVEALRTGTIDVGFLRPPVSDPELSLINISAEPLVLAISEAHPLAASDSISLPDLAAEPFVSYPSGASVYVTVMTACANAGFRPAVVQEAAETHTLISLVSAGLGVCLLPASVQNLRATGVAYRQLTGDVPRVELCAAWRREDRSPVVASFLEVTRELLT